MTPRRADEDHFAAYTTPLGSTVTLPFLTEQQAAEIAEQMAPSVPPARPDAAAGETTTCGQCQGAGGWHEKVEVKTPSGGTVITQKWVNCRPCGGTGQLPKK